jgi:hypothetical protein
MILGACVKPVGVNDFLNDDTIKGIIKPGSDIDIDYEHPEDKVPILVSGTSTVGEGDTVTVSIGNNVTIMVTNGTDYDTIEWNCNGSNVESGVTFTVDTADPPFNMKGSYPVSVIGTTADGVLYSVIFYIIVES